MIRGKIRILLAGLTAVALTGALLGCPPINGDPQDGYETVLVPNVKGFSLSEAESELLAAGLEVGTVSEEYSEDVAEGLVVRSIPSAYTVLPLGSEVDLILANSEAQREYDIGFEDGFAQDDWYWTGYFDGYDTIDFAPIYYDDSDIPYLESPPYDAGYWDGVCYAYIDGYFVNYHYAFILGFSEGYDNAFAPDYLDFLAHDQHTEYYHGGWIDGYNDGFSEGRVFGAFDYEDNLPFDWEDALADYELGTDLYFEEVDVETGEYGPVILYEYGLNPHDLVKRAPAAARILRGGILNRSIRSDHSPAKTVDFESRSMYRALSAEAANEMNFLPETSLRSDRELNLSTTWLERIESYLAGTAGAKRAAGERPVRVRTGSSSSP